MGKQRKKIKEKHTIFEGNYIRGQRKSKGANCNLMPNRQQNVP